MGDKIAIDKGMPMPSHKRGGKESIYPFREMLVGDSFLLENVAARNNIYNAAKRCGMKIMVRAERDQLRVWRIE